MPSRDGTFSEAEVIYQDHLDTLTHAMMTDDFDLFRSRMGLPHNVRTQNAEFWVEDFVKMKFMFKEVLSSMAVGGVSKMIRLVKHADFDGEASIIGMHETHKFDRTTYLARPYLNRLRLERHEDGIWRETHCANAIELHGKKFGLARTNPNKTNVPDLGTVSDRTEND